jgi:hypothetical protein
MIDMNLTYSTRDGIPVRILCVDGPSKNYPVIGIMEGSDHPQSWGANGKYDQRTHTSEYDLIEVKPKIVIERWFNVVQSPDYGLYIEQYSTKDAAIAARQVHGDTIITKAIPFVWRGCC